MSIPRRFHRLHPSATLACRSGRYGSSRCVVPDYRSGLYAPAVHSCTGQYTDTALPFLCDAFLNHFYTVSQEGGAVTWLSIPVQAVFFDVAGDVVTIVALSLSAVVFAFQLIKFVVLISAFDQRIRQHIWLVVNK